MASALEVFFNSVAL